MDYASVLESIVQATLNYIVVSTITNSNQQKTVTDMKTDLRTTKEDLMSEIKETERNIISQLKLAQQTLNDKNN